jgi:hypothetical protein
MKLKLVFGLSLIYVGLFTMLINQIPVIKETSHYANITEVIPWVGGHIVHKATCQCGRAIMWLSEDLNIKVGMKIMIRVDEMYEHTVVYTGNEN